MVDPKLDLELDKIIDVPPAWVWEAWTRPEHLTHWFTPAPWTTVACEIDLRPGGAFRTTMRSPEGEEFPNVGAYLEVVPERRLVWTNAVLAGFRPAPTPQGAAGFLFTAVIELEPLGSGTRYRARVLHADEAGRSQHDAMGFHVGWSAALDQLVAHMKRVRSG